MSEETQGTTNHTWQEACWEVNLNSYPAVGTGVAERRAWSLVHCCERCGAVLTLHQPNIDQADRLLGTCDECKSWYVTSRRANGDGLSPATRNRSVLTIDVCSRDNR